MIHSERIAIFHFFLNYWNELLRVGEDPGVYARATYFFDKLLNIWLKNNWSIIELIDICRKIDTRDELSNPTFFFGKEIFYVDHVKSCLELSILDL